MKFEPVTGKIGFVINVLRVKAWPEGKKANTKQQWSREHAEETKLGQEGKREAAGGDRPQDKCGGLVQVVHRAVMQREAALGHGEGVEHEGGSEQSEVDPVVSLKAAPPQESGVKHARAVHNDGEQKQLACRIQSKLRLG